MKIKARRYPDVNVTPPALGTANYSATDSQKAKLQCYYFFRQNTSC